MPLREWLPQSDHLTERSSRKGVIYGFDDEPTVAMDVELRRGFWSIKDSWRRARAAREGARA